MANPQKEHGYTPVANEIMEALCRTYLSPYEWRVLLAVLRKTWGWKRRSAAITYSELMEMTSLSRRNIQRAVRSLTLKSMLIVSSEPRRSTYFQFSKDYDRWKDITASGSFRRRGSGISTDYRESALTDYRDDTNRLQNNALTDYSKVHKVITEDAGRSSTGKGLRDPKETLKDIYKEISLKERLLGMVMSYFAGRQLPDDMPPEKLDLFLYKVSKGEIRPERIEQPEWYIKSLKMEQFPPLPEREEAERKKEAERIAKLRKEQEEHEQFRKEQAEEMKEKVRTFISGMK